MQAVLSMEAPEDRDRILQSSLTRQVDGSYDEQYRIVRPDGSVLDGWEMFVGERSYGRSNSRTALLRAWEARLEEAENGRPFAFRPMYRRSGQTPDRTPTNRAEEKSARPKAGRRSA
jgi:hypothetical protein